MKKSSNRSQKTTADNDLSLPAITEELAAPSLRTMEEIDSWIERDYPLFFNRERYEREKREFSVDKRFSLFD